MKKVIVVSDSFKGTLSSKEICAIARETVAQHFPDHKLLTIPVADGGEGTVDCFAEALEAETVRLTVQDPFGEPVEAAYCRKGSLLPLSKWRRQRVCRWQEKGKIPPLPLPTAWVS